MIEPTLTAEPSLIDFYPDFYSEPKSQLKEIKAENLFIPIVLSYFL